VLNTRDLRAIVGHNFDKDKLVSLLSQATQDLKPRNRKEMLASTLKRYVVPSIRTMQRNFNDWWKTVPGDLRDKARKGDESNKPLLNQVNYALLHLHLAGKHDAKPSHEELKDWLHTGQVDVLRTNK
jgi:hypothetical protein